VIIKNEKFGQIKNIVQQAPSSFDGIEKSK